VNRRAGRRLVLSVVAALLLPFPGPHVDGWLPMGAVLLNEDARNAPAAFFALAGGLMTASPDSRSASCRSRAHDRNHPFPLSRPEIGWRRRDGRRLTRKSAGSSTTQATIFRGPTWFGKRPTGWIVISALWSE